VASFLVAGLALLIAHLSWVAILIVSLVLISMGISWILDQKKEPPTEPYMHAGAFTNVWLIGGLLFLVGALFRYFIRTDVRAVMHCDHCGYEKGED
jgi:uncharacterized membrane protein YphA (DoxX/SURF4 family)